MIFFFVYSGTCLVDNSSTLKASFGRVVPALIFLRVAPLAVTGCSFYFDVLKFKGLRPNPLGAKDPLELNLDYVGSKTFGKFLP